MSSAENGGRSGIFMTSAAFGVVIAFASLLWGIAFAIASLIRNSDLHNIEDSSVRIERQLNESNARIERRLERLESLYMRDRIGQDPK